MATSEPTDGRYGTREVVSAPKEKREIPADPVVPKVDAEELRRQEMDEAWRLSSDGQG